MTAENYIEQTGYSFVPLHNPGNYSPTLWILQEKALGTEQFWQKQERFRRCTAVDWAPKNQIVTAVQPVLLSPLVDQLMGFRQVTLLEFIHNIFNSYGAIDIINLKEVLVNMMRPYDPAKPLARLMDKLEKGE